MLKLLGIGLLALTLASVSNSVSAADSRGNSNRGNHAGRSHSGGNGGSWNRGGHGSHGHSHHGHSHYRHSGHGHSSYGYASFGYARPYVSYYSAPAYRSYDPYCDAGYGYPTYYNRRYAPVCGPVYYGR